MMDLLVLMETLIRVEVHGKLMLRIHYWLKKRLEKHYFKFSVMDEQIIVKNCKYQTFW